MGGLKPAGLSNGLAPPLVNAVNMRKNSVSFMLGGSIEPGRCGGGCGGGRGGISFDLGESIGFADEDVDGGRGRDALGGSKC